MDPLIKSQLLYQLSYAPAPIDLSCQRYDVKRARRSGAPPVVSSCRNAGNVDRILDRWSGAGDEIRTHDPNLGKVVLYP